MIELYLAVALFGLGTYINSQKTQKEDTDPDLVKKSNIYYQNNSDLVKTLETKYGNALDEKCKDIVHEIIAHILKNLIMMKRLKEIKVDIVIWI